MSRFESFFCIFLVCRYLKVCFDVSSKRFLLFPSKLLAVVYMCLFFCWNFRYCYITMSRAAWHIFLNIVTSTVGSLVGRSNSPFLELLVLLIRICHQFNDVIIARFALFSLWSCWTMKCQVNYLSVTVDNAGDIISWVCSKCGCRSCFDSNSFSTLNAPLLKKKYRKWK